MIAIDGPAGSGKSTTALRVARALGFGYVDSGAFYRVATLLALRQGHATDEAVDGAAIARVLTGSVVEQRLRGEENEVCLDGEDVTEALRSPAVTRRVSRVAAEPAVRSAVTARLRESAAAGPLVIDGRDIGTVVFPRAALKVFLEASVEERARRRSAAEGRQVSPESLARRDDLDRSRVEAPLVRAADAVVLQSDDLTLEEQVDRIVALWNAAGGRP